MRDRSASGRKERGDEAAAPSAALPPRKAPRGDINHSPCITCKRLKVKCEGGLPCRRCFIHSTSCRPYLKRPAPGAEGACGPVGTEMVERSRIPLADTVLGSGSPKPLAELYIQGFEEALQLAAGGSRSQAIAVLRSWRFLGRASGQSHDLSWGVAQHVARHFGIGECDLEGLDSLQYPGRFMGGLGNQSRESLMEALELSNRELRASELYTRLSQHAQGGSALLLMTMGTDTSAMACNKEFSELILTASEITRVQMTQKTVVGMLMARLFAPDDRALYLRCIAQTLFSKPPQAITQFFKMYDAHGNIKLYIITFRSMAIVDPADEALGEHAPRRLAISACMERAPESRHVSLRPKHKHIATYFRNVSSCMAAAAAGGDGASAGGGAVVSSDASLSDSSCSGSGDALSVGGGAVAVCPPPMGLMSLPCGAVGGTAESRAVADALLNQITPEEYAALFERREREREREGAAALLDGEDGEVEGMAEVAAKVGRRVAALKRQADEARTAAPVPAHAPANQHQYQYQYQAPGASAMSGMSASGSASGSGSSFLFGDAHAHANSNCCSSSNNGIGYAYEYGGGYGLEQPRTHAPAPPPRPLIAPTPVAPPAPPAPASSYHQQPVFRGSYPVEWAAAFGADGEDLAAFAMDAEPPMLDDRLMDTIFEDDVSDCGDPEVFAYAGAEPGGQGEREGCACVL